MKTHPPRSESELLGRADELAGLSLGEVAERYRVEVPASTRRAKGWGGVLLETALGASAASRPEPDFQLIGVEMKTIPVDRRGKPKESTYVCTVPLIDHRQLDWAESNVRRKLNRVLWVPVEAADDVELIERRIGVALIWSPSPEEDANLKADWEELMDMVCLGQLTRITAHHGTWLQIRPKAANARSRRLGIEDSGRPVPTLPRGFYLRSGFTEAILRRHYAMPK